MIHVRPGEARGAADFGWLKSRHTFSFGSYMDPNHMGFGPLRVINEDHVAPGQGFATHGHRDMEILSYVLSGALEHRDSMGNGSVIRPGDVQRMSAGTGVRHSEYNASKVDDVHFLQIWILPEQQALAPSYEQKYFSPDDRLDQLRLIASRDGRDDSVVIHQDVDLYASLLSAGVTLSYQPRSGRGVWLQVARGGVELAGQALKAGDGASALDVETIELVATEDSELLIFDLGGFNNS
ncbi:MAG: pirin family protein [Halieaceae bacterium]|jgi:redox-sensitive bicupin YhaK (pirin superfamily)|nr:pirin family protein [Halieaceae bacterium]